MKLLGMEIGWEHNRVGEVAYWGWVVTWQHYVLVAWEPSLPRALLLACLERRDIKRQRRAAKKAEAIERAYWNF